MACLLTRMQPNHTARQQCTVFQFVASLTVEDDDEDSSDHDHEPPDHAEDYDAAPRVSVDDKAGSSCLIM